MSKLEINVDGPGSARKLALGDTSHRGQNVLGVEIVHSVASSKAIDKAFP